MTSGSSVDEGDVEDASKSVASFHNITQQAADDKSSEDEDPLSPDAGANNGLYKVFIICSCTLYLPGTCL